MLTLVMRNDFLLKTHQLSPTVTITKNLQTLLKSAIILKGDLHAVCLNYSQFLIMIRTKEHYFFLFNKNKRETTRMWHSRDCLVY
jgi:hypothetical protein